MLVSEDEAMPQSQTAYCPLCEREIPVCRTVDDSRPRYIDHNCRSGPRAGRECDNTGQLVKRENLK